MKICLSIAWATLFSVAQADERRASLAATLPPEAVIMKVDRVVQVPDPILGGKCAKLFMSGSCRAWTVYSIEISPDLLFWSHVTTVSSGSGTKLSYVHVARGECGFIRVLPQ